LASPPVRLRAPVACDVRRMRRRLFLVFGSPMMTRPPSRVSVRRTLMVASSRFAAPIRPGAKVGPGEV
jgi:hypothetical protein